MTQRAAWYPVPTGQSFRALGIPALLISTSFGRDSYAVHLTDLANLWGERLDRRQIVMRALQQDTSIDPSEGADQMAVFLRKLSSAFDASSPDHNEASVSLTAAKENDIGAAGEDGLVLEITCILPAPLKPLKWQMYLEKCVQSALAAELVLPLIQAHCRRAQEVGSLRDALKEKDAVINRLLDKLDGMGVGLEHIFHPLAGKRKVTRATAEEKVKGLAPFDAKPRGSSLEDEAGQVAEGLDELVTTAFGPSGLQYDPDFGVSGSRRLTGWWKELKSKPEGNIPLMGHQFPSTADTEPHARPSQVREESTNYSEDFQVQMTPPHLMSAKKATTCKIQQKKFDDDDDATTDSDDPDADGIPDSHLTPPSAQKVKVNSGPRSKPVGGIGSIGIRPRRVSKSPQPEERRHPRLATTSHGEDGSETASEADSAHHVAPNPEADCVEPAGEEEHKQGDEKQSSPRLAPTPLKEKPTAPSKKGALGRISGKKAARASPPGLSSANNQRPTTPDEESGVETTTPRKRNRMGHIGRAPPAAEEGRPDTTAGGKPEDSKTKKDEDEVLEEESMGQKADRRRLELDRELQRKAAAAPARKKRRF